MSRQRVAVVTGGGGGIGAAIAEELGRRGTFVVTVDPLVTLDGTERLPDPEETTAGRIVAAGGAARASTVSVTDGAAVRELFEGLAAELGGLDAVVNVAGITRPTGFASGTEADWLGVLDVHLGGYLNVLGAALPLMAAAGQGRVLGVTSGSGWRPADAGAYSCAKRAVAALTWQLGRAAPDGVAVNAISPIAATRMVAAALARAGSGAASTKASGGLSLASMPAPADLGPLGAHLVEAGFDWCNGRIFFAGGSEVAVVEEPRLLEVVRTNGVPSVAEVLGTIVPAAFDAAEASQATGGGSNARFAAAYDGSADVGGRGTSASRSVAVVTDAPALARPVLDALAARGASCHVVDAAKVEPGFAAAAAALASVAKPVDAVVVALAARPPAADGGWTGILAEHGDLVADLHADVAWTRAVADRAVATNEPRCLVTLTDAATAGGRSRAQAAAQLARAGRKATGDLVTPFAVAREGGDAHGELVAHLLCHDGADALSGAELVAGDGWVGLRSHPRPGGSVCYGGPAVPSWLDAALGEIAR